MSIYYPTFYVEKLNQTSYKVSFNVYRSEQCNHHAPWLLLFFIIIIMLINISLLMFVGGPKAACAGCAGFAAFSVLIEKFLDRHTWMAMNTAPVLQKINFSEDLNKIGEIFRIFSFLFPLFYPPLILKGCIILDTAPLLLYHFNFLSQYHH